MKDIYKFLRWKSLQYPQDFTENDRQIISYNTMNRFNQLSSKSCTYTKTCIRKYTETLWAQSLSNQQTMEGELVIAQPSCKPLPIPLYTDRSDEVLLMSLFYTNNLMNSFVYRHTYNAESPLCPRCQREEQTAYHVIMECNDLLEKIQLITNKILGEASSINHHNTLLNCSRNSEFIKCAIEILRRGNFRRQIEGIIPA